MKIYTRGGDKGSTDLFGGQRVGKDAIRINANGVVDELNCVIGLARVNCGDGEIDAMLGRVQSDLFVVGGDLSLLGDSDARGELIPIVTEADVDRLEQWVDLLTEKVGPMTHFVLPGGCECAARLHVARAVCRRAERTVVHLAQGEPINPFVVPFINRLADLLFVMARRANQLSGVGDTPWIRPAR